MAATEVEIAATGEYLGHWQEPYMLTVEDLQRMATNFASEVVIDYEHQTHDPDADRAPAAGWITRVWVQGESLWGEVEWTSEAEAMIDSEEYRYLSPVFNFDAKDPETGNPIGIKLVTVGLTNVPFMQGMEPVTENEGPAGALGRLPGATAQYVENEMTARPAVLNTELGDYIREKREEKGMTIEELAEEVDLSPSAMGGIERGEIEVPPPSRRQKLASALGVEPSTLRERIPDDKLENSQNSDFPMSDWFQKFKKKLKGVLNSEAEGEMDLLDEVRQLRSRVEELEGVKEERDELQNKLEQKEERLSKLQEEKQEKEEKAKEELLDEAVENYRIAASDREDWEERLEENPESARLALNSIPKGAVKPGSGVEEPEDPGSEESDPARPSSGYHDYARQHSG